MTRRTAPLSLVLLLGCAPAAGTRPAARPAMPLPAAVSAPLAMASEPPPATRVDAPPAEEAAPEPSEPIEDDLAPREDGEGAPQPWLDDPRLQISDAELAEKLKKDLGALGSLSVGRAASGRLYGGRPMPEGERWTLISPALAWATEETIAYLERAIAKVHDDHPGGHPLQIGHISAKHGGHLSPHKSHQAGRDVDISFFYKTEARQLWYRRANAENLDRERTWAFIRALVTETDVEYIFINSPIQRLLKEHALRIGEDPEWLDSIFQWGSRHRSPIVRHAPGHDTHIHIRFFNPIAQELGRRAYPVLVAMGKIQPSTQYIHYKVKKGDLLGRLANRFGTTVEAIQRANGLRNTRIRAGKVYRIPKKTPAQLVIPARTRIPPRRLPPSEPDKGGASKARAAAQ